ncbi:DUF5106 domain-containing protein [Fulvivirga sp. M361]|uniref:DUF5106 domain-containing protein n=1 Tax=Fulvivirga sp. M361 TaxID=2594266 RepID=UPI00117B5182|nr:thioredoxin-like domain-containing protein [Fulvivirga sp. M361]TRX52008.1 DUF5106 domain-containing protein [Fulvivirga sp. M361]
MRKLSYIFFGLILITSCKLSAQGYKMDFKIEGLPDTTFLLGNFFGESTYVQDTARSNHRGEFSFEGNKALESGMYFIVLDKVRLFDFVIGKDQTFTMETKHPDYIKNLKINGDTDNELFLEDMLFNAERNSEAQPFVMVLKDSLATPADKKVARENLNKVGEKVAERSKRVIQNHPDAVVSKLMRANQDIDIPEPPLLENGQVDSTWRYKYYRKHYWDGFDLSDPTLLRFSRPVYRNKLEDYFDRLILPNADSITKAIDELSVIAGKNQETYKYFIWNMTIKYQHPEIMGLDKIFVHLYDTYFASGKMDYWANEQLKNNLKERADQLRNSLVGMKAPNLIMQNQDLKRRALYDLTNKYTVIYFYDPDCGHCKKETPRLKEFYDGSKFDIGVFAVSADTSMTKMRDYIEKMKIDNWVNVNGPRTYTVLYQKQYDASTTPTIYVLNEEKNIIAKKIPAERLEEFLLRYEEVEAYQKRNKPN